MEGYGLREWYNLRKPGKSCHNRDELGFLVVVGVFPLDACEHDGELYDAPLDWFRFDADFSSEIGRSALFNGSVSDFGRWAKLLVILARVKGHVLRMGDNMTCDYVMRCLEFSDKASLAAFVARMSATGVVDYDPETDTVSERQVSESAEKMASKRASCRRAGKRSGQVRSLGSAGEDDAKPRLVPAEGERALNAPKANLQLELNTRSTDVERTLNTPRTKSNTITVTSTVTSTSTKEHRQKRGDEEAIGRVISHLNDVAHKSYRASSKRSAQAVRARLADGYTEEQLLHVIDVKCEEWLGTDMEKFLRPETLFAPSHIEGYVNQPTRASMRQREREIPRGQYGVRNSVSHWSMPVGQ